MNLGLGLITFHRALNYGAVLQTYALYSVLTRLGGNVTVLDYRNPVLEERHKPLCVSTCRKWTDLVRLLFLSRNHNHKYRKFRRFLMDNVNLSGPLCNLRDLERVSDDYAGFITGSDQVWNGNITGWDPAYFLVFTDVDKRNSYAASFGFAEIPEGRSEEYRRLLCGFKHMSVREQQAATVIQGLIGKRPEVVLDPTLLLRADEWEEISIRPKRKRYILVYGFAGENYLRFASGLARKTGLRIVCIGNPLFPKPCFAYERDAGPEEFLGLFRDASYIVTNSFHGVAFAINFNVPFFLEFLPEASGVNARLENIVDLFGLSGRLISRGEIANQEFSMDFSLINSTLESERQKSFRFLRMLVSQLG